MKTNEPGKYFTFFTKDLTQRRGGAKAQRGRKGYCTLDYCIFYGNFYNLYSVVRLLKELNKGEQQ
jgi:hypothetical protein